MSVRRSARLRQNAAPLKVSQEEWLQMAGEPTPLSQPANKAATTTNTSADADTGSDGNSATPTRSIDSTQAQTNNAAPIITPLPQVGEHKLIDNTSDTTLDITDNHLSRWQFSAPRYVDLGRADDETDNTSQWFGKQNTGL
jgi:hypothetical protein